MPKRPVAICEESVPDQQERPVPARYAFFRDPHGKPYRKGDGKHAPKHLLTRIGETAISSGGGISWPGSHAFDLQTALQASIAILDANGRELNEADSGGLVVRALADELHMEPRSPIDPVKFLLRLDRAVSEFWRRPVEQYYLMTSLSLANLPAKRISVGPRVISSIKREDRFPLPPVLSSLAHRDVFREHFDGTKYRFVKVSTEGRSVNEANESALRALGILRGLWSLIATYGSRINHFGPPKKKPLGIIHTGPVFTLHYPDGQPIKEDMYLFEPSWHGDHSLYDGSGQWSAIEKHRRRLMRRMASLVYRADLETLLIRYIDALDQVDHDVAFLQLWGILEMATDTRGGPYEETIKRATWVYSSDMRPWTKDVLDVLRHRRNRYVHSGQSTRENEDMAYLVKSYVDPHLSRLLNNLFKVQSLEEYGEYLALPCDPATLDQKMRKLCRAKRFLTT